MPRGIGGNFCTPGGAQGGAQGADFGVLEGANYSIEFCTLFVPISVISHHILRRMVCKCFGRTCTHTTNTFLHLHVCKRAKFRTFAHPQRISSYEQGMGCEGACDVRSHVCGRTCAVARVRSHTCAVARVRSHVWCRTCAVARVRSHVCGRTCVVSF